jgi:hypothetical protein
MKVTAAESALLGIRRAQEMVNGAAKNIANPDFAKEEPNLVQDIVDLKEGKNLQEANIAVLKTDDEMKKNLIDIIT